MLLEHKRPSYIYEYILRRQPVSNGHSNGVFFSPKKYALYLKKNAILCLFVKNVSPSKRLVCFILNNLHFQMMEGIAFYALYKTRVMIIPCEFCLIIRLPDEI